MTWTIPDQGEPANDLQAVLFQSSLDALASGYVRTGVRSGCAVTAQGTPDMTVAVAAGTVALAGVAAAVIAGNVTIGAADGTNPRLDLIVSNGSGTKSVIAGAAAANPKEPTLDTTTYVLLAQVYVPAAATTITTARIVDRRVMLAGNVAQPFPSGRYTVAPSPFSGSLVTNGNGTGEMRLVPVLIPRTLTVTSLSIDVSIAGSAGAVYRLGIYTTAAGLPGALVVDGGTVSATSTGIKTLTVSQVLDPGLYWLAHACQGANSSTAALQASSGTYPGGHTYYVAPATAGATNAGCYFIGGVTGALPSSVASPSALNECPVFWIGT